MKLLSGSMGVLVVTGLMSGVLPSGAAAYYQAEDEEEPEAYAPRYEPTGSGFEIGGGVSEFKAGPMREMTGSGGTWDARLIFGMRTPISLEIGYVGAAYPLMVSRNLQSGYLVSNGMEMNLRLNIPMIDEDVMVEPYILGGVGWNWFSTAQTDLRIRNILTADNTFYVPLGTGMVFSFDGLLLDARFTYRFANSKDLELNTLGRSGVTSSWAFTGHIGCEF